MIKSIFFPILKRRKIHYYYNNRKSFYADYRENYPKVADDCYHKCVYCDISERECGGDPFSLDHFRPQQIFSEKFDGALEIHPYNLYLSCQKCNVLKSNDWKGCKDTIDGFSFSNRQGYIDRFKDDFNEHLKVLDSGELISINESGPGNYMIKKMMLNRVNRVFIRKRRIFNYQLRSVSLQITEKMSIANEKWNSGEIDNSEMSRIIAKLICLKKEFDSLL